MAAAEWDNLIPDGREMSPRNGSFQNEIEDRKPESSKTSKSKKQKAFSPASSEQSLLSEEQNDHNVTELVMEYTDIFEPSMQRKIDFIDIQEGDAISEVSDDEIVAHSREQKMYEDTKEPDIDSEESGEDLSRVPPIDTGVDTFGIDVDMGLNNGIADEDEGHDEDIVIDKGGHESLGDNIETSLAHVVKIEENGEVKIAVDAQTGRNGDSERESESGEKDKRQVEDEKQSDDDELEEKIEILVEDDDSESHTEEDKLLVDDTKVEIKPAPRKTKTKMVSAGTQAHEEKPLLNSSGTSSPEPVDSLQQKKQFTPREYPGKAVKSIAIGTDDFPSNGHSRERHVMANSVESQRKENNRSHVDTRTPPQERVRSPPETDPPPSTRSHRTENTGRGSPASHTPRSNKHPRGERGSQSSDAMFFKSRLPQTSKRHPKRHVWLVRDSEIHRLIAEKAAILRRYKEEGIKGRVKSKGFPHYSEVDVLGLPSVGFSGRTKDDSYRSSLPYGKHPSSRSSQGGYRGGSSSEDEDERTNRLSTKGGKSSGTFAVGLAARREQTASKQHEPGDEEEGCELCAAEAREKEKHEKKLKELEAAAKAGPHHPRNLMLGIVYSGKFLGSTNLMSPSAPNKAVRLQQAQEAIGRIKVPEGEEQPSSDVDLFISTERIKIVNSNNKQPLTDHHLKTISFIADIGNIIVVMARLSIENDSKTWSGKMPDFSPQKQQQEEKTTKVICHVLETPEAQTVAKTVGQAFSIAYHEFLKVNRLNLGEIEDMEYNGILEQQKILGEELSLLADESKSKEVVIHKKYGESLLLMIVESGWGSMIPTVVIAHMDNKGPAAKSGQLNVGNQILAVNGQSLVGLPLLECQNIIKAMKYEERVAFKVVSCPPTVEISINRPDTKYQLGFSVQNGMICSLMRGGIAERGGVRVGHKIIEMNGESVVAASHHHIVDILQTTIGELRMKTMPITLYKLLVGLEIPQYL